MTSMHVCMFACVQAAVAQVICLHRGAFHSNTGRQELLTKKLTSIQL